MTPAQRLTRITTQLVVRAPGLWLLERGAFRRYFDRLAPRWDSIIGAFQVDAVAAALEGVKPPRRVLDLGTGTGAAAFLVAARFPDAHVTGVDLSPRMVEAARAKTPAHLVSRVRFLEADAADLPFESGVYDLVTLANMIPFFDEIARVLTAHGVVLISFAEGPRTPIWVDPHRLRAELARRGFTGFSEVRVGESMCVVAER